jgi:hypothetical protein
MELYQSMWIWPIHRCNAHITRTNVVCHSPISLMTGVTQSSLLRKQRLPVRAGATTAQDVRHTIRSVNHQGSSIRSGDMYQTLHHGIQRPGAVRLHSNAQAMTTSGTLIGDQFVVKGAVTGNTSPLNSVKPSLGSDYSNPHD